MTCGTDLATGKVEAMEIGKEIPGQLSFADEVVEQEVDEETGEIINTSKIVDLRKAREA